MWVPVSLSSKLCLKLVEGQLGSPKNQEWHSGAHGGLWDPQKWWCCCAAGEMTPPAAVFTSLIKLLKQFWKLSQARFLKFRWETITCKKLRAWIQTQKSQQFLENLRFWLEVNFGLFHEHENFDYYEFWFLLMDLRWLLWTLIGFS